MYFSGLSIHSLSPEDETNFQHEVEILEFEMSTGWFRFDKEMPGPMRNNV